jgi:hypothetical protein
MGLNNLIGSTTSWLLGLFTFYTVSFIALSPKRQFCHKNGFASQQFFRQNIYFYTSIPPALHGVTNIWHLQRHKSVL